MKAIDRFDRAGMVSAIATGNTGPGDETVKSPGFAPRAIGVGASSVGHYVGWPVTTADGGRFGAASGEFATVEEDLTAPRGRHSGCDGSRNWSQHGLFRPHGRSDGWDRLDLARNLLILNEDPQRAGGGTACPNKRSHLCPRWLTVKLRRAHQISTHRLSAAQSGQSARRNPIAQRCTHAATAARCSGSH